MKIRLLLFALGLGGIFAFTVSSQTPPTTAPSPVTAAAASPCPKLEIQAPSGRVIERRSDGRAWRKYFGGRSQRKSDDRLESLRGHDCGRTRHS